MFPTTKRTASPWTVTEELWTTFVVPFGPVMAHWIVLTCSPPGKVSCRPTLPMSPDPDPGPSVERPDLDEGTTPGPLDVPRGPGVVPSPSSGLSTEGPGSGS